MTPETLRHENRFFRDTGGVSHNNGTEGFCSAFMDRATGCIYLSRFANGSPAPMHLLNGLPEELVSARDAAGRVTAVKQTVVAGFLYAERFYTRQQAARILESKITSAA